MSDIEIFRRSKIIPLVTILFFYACSKPPAIPETPQGGTDLGLSVDLSGDFQEDGGSRNNNSTELDLDQASSIAGPNQNVLSGETVSLRGIRSLSTASAAKFSWIEIAPIPNVSIKNADQPQSSFIAPWMDPDNNRLKFRLTHTSPEGETKSGEVNVNVTNSAPLSDPGRSFIVLGGTEVSLDGSASRTIDGGNNISQYKWTSHGENTVRLTNPNAPKTSFDAPLVSGKKTFTFSLKVTEGAVSDTKTVDIIVVESLTFNDFGGRYYGIDIDPLKRLAYVARGEGGLGIFDISSPSNTREIGAYNTPGNTQDVKISGTYAYLADQYHGLSIVDISSPSTPVLVAQIDTAGRSTALAIKNNYLYLASYSSGLITVDISQPGTPVIVSTVDTMGRASDVVVSDDGRKAYLADERGGIVVFDLTAPDNPLLEHSIVTPGKAFSLALGGAFLYVADGNIGIEVYNISNPNIEPQFLKTIDTGGQARKVVLEGATLWVANGKTGIRSFDISIGDFPVPMSSFGMNVDAEDLAVFGNDVIVADGYRGLSVIDVSLPDAPKQKFYYPTIGTATGIDIQGKYAFVSDYYNGLIVVDISNPFSPKLRSHYPYDEKGGSRGIVINGNYAYIADSNTGLRIVDISNLDNLNTVATKNVGRTAMNLVISPDSKYAYMATLYAGLVIVDISDPTGPIKLGSNTFQGSQSKKIALDGNFVFIANGSESFAISDISDPSMPTQTSILQPAEFPNPSPPGDGHDIKVEGNYAYLAHNAGTLAVIDIRVIDNPLVVGKYSGGRSTIGVKSINSLFIQDNFLFATNSNVDSARKGKDDYLLVWDISDPNKMKDQPDAYLQIGGRFPEIKTHGIFMLLAGEALKVIDLSDPLNPHD